MSIMFPCQLFTILKDAPEGAILKISSENDQFNFDVEKDHPHHSPETLHHFKRLLGEDRFIQICGKEEIQINPHLLENRTVILTKDVVRKFFIGYAYFELHRAAAPGTFPVRTMQELKQLMMGGSPTISEFIKDRPLTSGHGFRGLTERVFLTYLHYNQVINDMTQDMEAMRIRDVEFLTSRLGDRELRLNTIVYLSDGVFTVTANFIGKGAYVSILENEDKSIPPKIVCRGTAGRRTATEAFNSVVNDLILEMGTLGIKTIWPGLSSYLEQNQIKSVDILGKSLGGAHAQELAILIEGLLNIRVNSLTTLCSVGVGEDINTLFMTQVLSRRVNDPFNLCVIRNGGNSTTHDVDYIPAVGGEHIGFGAPEHLCKKEVIYIVPTQENTVRRTVDVSTISAKGGKCGLSCDFIRSFMTAHLRQTTLETFTIRKINPHKVDKHLSAGMLLEPYRQKVAKVLDMVTFSRWNGETFTDYYYNRQEGIR